MDIYKQEIALLVEAINNKQVLDDLEYTVINQKKVMAVDEIDELNTDKIETT